MAITGSRFLIYAMLGQWERGRRYKKAGGVGVDESQTRNQNPALQREEEITTDKSLPPLLNRKNVKTQWPENRNEEKKHPCCRKLTQGRGG